ncbi:RNA recognition motif domain-containing protein [Spartinivicinus ruber]|uniref:RNA recognition motif domain-containing protein n=1 Tax=Spartinivicinus ruber TaxID=2683272 RepID=UPI0013D00F4A|nr:RNA-binding protein [Spartinivicinus ruber]
MQQNKLYVGNLPYCINESQLDDLFSQYGEIDDIKLILDRETGRSKGFAFITFASEQAAKQALQHNGIEVEGRTIKVNKAIDNNRQRNRRHYSAQRTT